MPIRRMFRSGLDGSVAWLTYQFAWLSTMGFEIEVDSAEELVQGRGDGVGVSSDGRLQRVDRWQATVSFE